MVPLHPQRCADEPDLLRWVIPADLLDPVGVVAAAPPPLAGLLADGTLAELRLEPAAVVTRLGPRRSWQDQGPRVRGALHAALGEPDGWHVVPDSGARAGDAVLRTLAQQLLDGSVGRFAAAHGGRIDLVDVRDDVVTVRLAGACNGCPAARSTLHGQLEHRLRQRYPALRAVVDHAARSSASRTTDR